MALRHAPTIEEQKRVKFGYVRVSAKDQNTDRQLKKMRSLGIEERYIFEDKQSGKNFNRPKYQAMKMMIQEGDLIYLDALDRLGRDYPVLSKNGSILPGS